MGEQFRKHAIHAADILGKEVYSECPFLEGVQPELDPTVEGNLPKLLIQKTWWPTLCITGMEGVPDLAGGNVLRKETKCKISIRLPPDVDPRAAMKGIKKAIEHPYPQNAKVKLLDYKFYAGFAAPVYQPWLANSLDNASESIFGNKPVFLGAGGGIPFMNFLKQKFPEAQFVITGVLGPKSNAHGPDEFMHIGMAKKLSAAMGCIIYDYGVNFGGGGKLTAPQQGSGNAAQDEMKAMLESLRAQYAEQSKMMEQLKSENES